MDLAHHNQAINTRRGAAFGFAGIAKLAGSQLSPHLGSLIPKLYRYQYDPNQRVQVRCEQVHLLSGGGGGERSASFRTTKYNTYAISKRRIRCWG